MMQTALKIWHTVDDRFGITKNLKPIMDHRYPRRASGRTSSAPQPCLPFFCRWSRA